MKRTKMFVSVIGGLLALSISANAADFTPIIYESEAPTIRLSVIGTYGTDIFDEDAAEIAAHDSKTQRLFVTNVADRTVDVLDISDPATPKLLFQIDVSKVTTPDGHPNSVAVRKGIVAVAVQVAVDEGGSTEPGAVAFFRADADADEGPLTVVPVGPQPDMLIFTPNGNKLLVANEGEPSEDYTVDPEGSISIIDITRDMAKFTVTTLGFSKFNDQKDELTASGVRIFGPGASVAQDLEPEYIAVSNNSKTAWVTLQENNALAVVDIKNDEVTDILPLGFKDHSFPPGDEFPPSIEADERGNGLDASNEDGNINITNWPVFGM